MLRHTILFMLLIGMASAAWYPAAQNVNTTGDIFAEDGTFSGSISVTGLGTFGGGTVNNGVYDGDLRWAANHSLYSTAGTGGLDFSNETGIWKMPTGQGTIGGAADFNGAITCRNITLDNDYHIVQGGTGSYTSGTGAFDVNGAMTTKAITADANYNITTQGTGDLVSADDADITDTLYVADIIQSNDAGFTNVDISGTFDVDTPTMTARNITLDANMSLALSGTGTISGAASVSAGDITATGDGFITDDLTVDGLARVDESLTANSLVVNTTTDINGATTTAAITVDSGSIVTADQFLRRTVTNATNFTITDDGADVYLVGNGTGVNTQTILFPTAAANKGRIITIILATDPLSNSVILDGENSETIDTATTKTTTDAVGSMYHLICNGVGWVKIASSGSWS